VESEHDFGRRQTSIRNRIVNFPLTYLIMESINETIIEAQVVEALRTCFDPEIPVNIYEMGLIYDLKVAPEGAVTIQMTLTSPHCPAVQSLPAEVESKVRAVPGVSAVAIDLVWDPPWDPSKMSEAARLQLGMM
jgi:FeS assembly SUF system protein